MKKYKPKKYNKKWGYELWIENNQYYCGKLLHVVSKKKSSVHYHKNKIETFYVIKGALIVEYSEHLDKEKWEKKQNIFVKKINKGECFCLKNYVAHRFYSATSGVCEFIEVSTYHDEKDSYRIIKSK